MDLEGEAKASPFFVGTSSTHGVDLLMWRHPRMAWIY